MAPTLALAPALTLTLFAQLALVLLHCVEEGFAGVGGVGV